MTLGEALKLYRIKNDLLQKQMAYKLGISTEYYCKIENDKVLPSKNLLLKICNCTGINVEIKVKIRIKTPSNRFTHYRS